MRDGARDRTGALLLGLLVWLSCAWFGSWEWNPNNATRLFAAVSLVENGDATIDEFAALTIDKAQFGNHVYLDKAPGMTLMAMPAVWLADRAGGDDAHRHPLLLGDPGLARFLRLRLRLAAASGPALLTGIAAALLYDLALGLTGSGAAALVAGLGYALGTPIWGWSTTIFGHAAVAALYVVAAWGIWRRTPGGAVLAGLALGWAVVVEYQAVLGGAVLGVWALARWWPLAERWRLIGPAYVGGVVALLPLVGYDLLAFGTPFRIGYQGVVGFEGMHAGLFGLTLPSPQALGQIVVGPRRGLIWVAPVLVVAPLGLWLLAERRRTRGLAWAALGVTVVVLLVNAAYIYWDGGNSTGPRLAMPMTGLLALGLAPFWTSLAGLPGRIATTALLGVSIALNACIASAQVFSGPDDRFPVWSDVIVAHFLAGDLRTWPGEWLGWSPWAGFALWAVVALPLGGWLAWRLQPARLTPRARCQT